MDKRIVGLKQIIDKVKDEIKKMIDLLKEFMENINIYYNINNDVYNSFNNKMKNYEVLKNIREIPKNEIVNDLIKIMNENNMCDKFKQIINIYNIMNYKNEEILFLM